MSALGFGNSAQQGNAQQLSFKSYQPKQYPPTLSSLQVAEHERIRCRGFTPEEVHFFKARDRWVKGEVVSGPPPRVG